MGRLQTMPEELLEGEIGTRPKTAPRPRLFRTRRSVWLDPRASQPAALPAPATAPRRAPLANAFAFVGLLIGLAWSAVTFPFRLTFRILAFLGRVAGVLVGFALMVLGASLFPGPLVLFGVPIFGLGLVMTLRSVE